MEQLEKVEKLRERADVSYEEAKEALEACDWDLLDAMVYGSHPGSTGKIFSTDTAASDDWCRLLETSGNQGGYGCLEPVFRHSDDRSELSDSHLYLYCGCKEIGVIWE